MIKKGDMDVWKLLSVTIVYLLVSVLHVFFLPHFNVDNSKAPIVSNSIFKRHSFTSNNQNGISQERTDKSTLDDKRKALVGMEQLAVIGFFFLFAFTGFKRLKTEFFPVDELVQNRQYAYLQLCTFRI